MPTYIGRVVSPKTKGAPAGAGGPLTVTVPDRAGMMVSGYLKIGARPLMAGTGFSGVYEGGAAFEASGENTITGGKFPMHLSLVLQGTRAPDGKTVSGTVLAMINGVEQSEWTFVGSLEGVALPKMVASQAPGPGNGAVGAFEPGALVPSMGLEEEQGGALSQLWSKTSSSVKVAAGLVAAGFTGLYFYRRRKG